MYFPRVERTFLLKKGPVDFRNPLPFRRLSAKPHQSKRLWGLG